MQERERERLVGFQAKVSEEYKKKASFRSDVGVLTEQEIKGAYRRGEAEPMPRRSG